METISKNIIPINIISRNKITGYAFKYKLQFIVMSRELLSLDLSLPLNSYIPTKESTNFFYYKITNKQFPLLENKSTYTFHKWNFIIKLSQNTIFTKVRDIQVFLVDCVYYDLITQEIRNCDYYENLKPFIEKNSVSYRILGHEEFKDMTKRIIK